MRSLIPIALLAILLAIPVMASGQDQVVSQKFEKTSHPNDYITVEEASTPEVNSIRYVGYGDMEVTFMIDVYGSDNFAVTIYEGGSYTIRYHNNQEMQSARMLTITVLEITDRGKLTMSVDFWNVRPQ
ncbi:hypothetical protein HOB10_02640 [Candidatus Parcubacteria bacterium]|jgi:hypothetical protein|nr:hypothetical protein [Candidatus Parcubacteria bacterium]